MNAKFEYSDKIRTRRRSLFPNENCEEIERLSDNSDEMCNLTASDTEYVSELMNDKSIRSISSTKLINDILSTPRSKRELLLIEDSMSPLYLSPMKNQNSHIPEISPTRFLKTPNDSNAHSDLVPKLSRKSLLEHYPADFESLSSPPVHSKCSKVRTSLFPEVDDISPKQFYPKSESLKQNDNSFNSSDKRAVRMNRGSKRRSRVRHKKKISGQINAGVSHKIKKPKEKTKTIETAKTLSVDLPKIKTTKPEKPAVPESSELSGFFDVLQELNMAKTQKLIRTPVQQKRAQNYDENDDAPNSKRLKTASPTQPTLFEPEPFEPLNISNEINGIIDFLDSSKENTPSAKEVTKALLSPTTEISNMASEMKIDSPKKSKNLNRVLETMAEDKQNQIDEVKDTKKRCFPIFSPNYKPENRAKNDANSKQEPKKKKMKVASDQMLLDAGQKRFGITECPECGYVYHISDPSDEKGHDEYHNGTRVLQFQGWKNERVLENFTKGDRIIEILPGDSNSWISKAQKVLDFVNRDMGFFDVTLDISKLKIFFYISHRTIAGCLVAESKIKGHKVLFSEDDVERCSEEEFPIKCGVLRLWVSPRFRKKGIATKLMDTLKSRWTPSEILTNSDIAVSSPTDDGKSFAVKYFGTPNFLTYMY